MSFFGIIKDTFNIIKSIFPKLTGDILIYGVGGSFAQIIGLITLPIITRILVASEMGTVDVVNATTGYFSALISLNIAAGLMRNFFEVPAENITERKKLVSSLIWFTIIFGGLVVLFGIAISSKLSAMLFDDTQYSLAISLALASLPFIILKNIFSNIFRMQRKPVSYLVLNTVYAILNFFLILLFVVPLKMHITGIFAAQVIASFIIAIVSAWYCREFIKLTFSIKSFTNMAAYGLPMMPGSIFQWGMVSINRILLTQYTDTSQIAYYGVALKAAKIIELAVTSFTLAWEPFFLAHINSESFHQKLNKALWYFALTALFLAAVVAVYSKEFFRILAPVEYQVGAVLVGILCLRQVFFGSSYIIGAGVIQQKKTYLISLSLGFGIAATIGMGFLLMPKFGIVGAALADLTGEMVNVITYFIFSNRLKKIPWNLRRVGLAIFGYIILWILTIGIRIQNLYIDFGIRSFLLTLYILFLFVIVDRGAIIRDVWINIKNRYFKPELIN